VKCVGHRDEFHAGVRSVAERIGCCARATPATANEREFDLVAAHGMGEAGDIEIGEQHTASDGGLLEESPA